MPAALIATLDGLSGSAAIVTPQSEVVIGQRAGLPSPSVFVKVGATWSTAADPVPSPSYGPRAVPPQESAAEAHERLVLRQRALADLRTAAEQAGRSLDRDPLSREAGARAVALFERAEVAAWLVRLVEQRVTVWAALQRPKLPPPEALALRQQLGRLLMADQAIMAAYRRRAALPVSPPPTSSLEVRARLGEARREYARAIRL